MPWPFLQPVSKKNSVTLAGSPLDDDIIASIRTNRHHPTLDVKIPDNVKAVRLDDLAKETIQTAEIIVIGVSSAGIDWATEYLNKQKANPTILSLVTKGLVEGLSAGSPPLTYVDTLASSLGMAED